MSHKVRLLSGGGYGEQGGDPISEHPQDQGPRQRIDTEHPGPEPVAEGRGKSGIKGKPVPKDTRGTGGDHGTINIEANARAAELGRKAGEHAKTTHSSSDSSGTESGRHSKSGARPIIHDETTPRDKGEEAVEKHNRELREREHSEVARDDHEKVEKGFWRDAGDKESI
ncbi:hypothetical protein BDZ91DRAFT_796750 [Kalaharituber pfeilii]|nr:hypothetical protein BDZ91DRAFT_796750 [Kalaharituber pfeilii]